MDDMILTRTPTANRPLLGLTVLVVEDSRFACEAMRLLCQRSGARIRRADSLQHARRHLAVYRPSVVLVDVGLPDGCGLDLISALAQATPRIDVILGISGDTTVQDDVISAGADGFIPKPISNLAAFQSAILKHLPLDRQPPGPRVVTDEMVNPDLMAFQDDLHHIAQVLENADSNIDYVTQFLGGVARCAKDKALGTAVKNLADLRTTGHDLAPGRIALSNLVQKRLSAAGPL